MTNLKKPEEYLDQIDSNVNLDGSYEEIKSIVIQIQRDFYNQAIDDAVENVTLLEEGVDIGKEYLMEQYNTFYRDTLFNINNQSILKLKI